MDSSNIFEAIFATDVLDTVFTAPRGAAPWAARDAKGVVFNDKGYGRLAA